MPHMTEKQEMDICDVINRWPIEGKLTWESIIKVVEKRFRIKFTRQTLSKHEPISIAYRTRKELMSQLSQKKYRRSASKSMSKQQAFEKIDKLEKENLYLRKINKLLKAQFARWAHNAQNAGLSFDFLNKSLPSKIKDKNSEEDEWLKG